MNSEHEFGVDEKINLTQQYLFYFIAFPGLSEASEIASVVFN